MLKTHFYNESNSVNNITIVNFIISRALVSVLQSMRNQRQDDQGGNLQFVLQRTTQSQQCRMLPENKAGD